MTPNIKSGPVVIKFFFMLNSTVRETLNAHKYKNIKKFRFSAPDKLNMLFVLFINAKMPTVFDI